jgi:molybdenum cofactor biosynthesis protein B
MSQSTAEHRAESPQRVRCAVITVSDTRTLQTDRGGQTLVEMLSAAGHEVTAREIVPDEPDSMRPLLEAFVVREDIDAVLMTGGTGIGSRDQTYETVTALLTKTVPGYGELFRMLSYEEVGTAAMLSRAVGGLIDRTVLLTMPGSPAAVRLAMDKVILPELGHLVHEARK